MTASRGRVQRAGPIATLFEQREVRLVGSFPELEDQLCAMTGAGYAGDGSPDRADAMVWALTELMLGQHTGRIFSGRAIPGAEHLHPRWDPKIGAVRE